MIVFHGSLREVSTPDVSKSKPYVDFGPAFYVTTFQHQAERWALRKANRSGGAFVAHVNKYTLNEAKLAEFRVLRHAGANEEWLDYVCACRKGIDVYSQWDIVIGPVANDDVFKSVNKYFKGEWTKEETLRKLSYLQQSDQIAFINPKCILETLTFISSYILPAE